MQEILGTDVAGRCDFSLPAPVSCYDALLVANVAITIPIPSSQFNRAFFSYSPGATVWVTLDGSTPTVPSGVGISTQELNPGVRQLNIINNVAPVMKVISDTAAYVNVRFDQSK